MNKEIFLKTFQQSLQEKFKGSQQEWWSNYIYHFSHIKNIVEILNCGKLYSRNQAIKLGLMTNDNANDEVIQHTQHCYKDYVRFYFRPKTPTQYINEGIIPLSEVANNAHCPIPVFLLFDFVKILSQDDVLFSEGNIANRGVKIYNNLAELNNLEFNNIFHSAPLPQESYREHIKYCRHAEVLVKDELNVYDYLKLIVVRSQADKESLLFWLKDEARKKLYGKIKIDPLGLFNHRWLSLERVELQANKLIFHFENTQRKSYDVRVNGEKLTDGERFAGVKTSFSGTRLCWNFDANILVEGLHVILSVDNTIIYENEIKYIEDDII
ncbi:MAG: DarT ssDNA thymidine ADP-ribosyltransferase family protein [Sulfurospirillaceae bacterium]|nr:DarT ssDNA thymidine ADP-ribosyltransferase family protein [Sulfurospirillaceae bacterium]